MKGHFRLLLSLRMVEDMPVRGTVISHQNHEAPGREIRITFTEIVPALSFILFFEILTIVTICVQWVTISRHAQKDTFANAG